MSVVSTRTLKGKEYLLEDVNFIGTFNPHINNTYDNTIENSVSNTLVDVYIFDKTNYNEPTKEEFNGIKTVSEIISSGTGTPSTYLTTTGNFNFVLDSSTKTKTITLNGTMIFNSAGVYPESQDQTIYDNYFIVLKVQETKAGKTYTDIPTREQLLLIPSIIIQEKNITVDIIIPGPDDFVWNETFQTGLTNTIFTNIMHGSIINTGKRIYYFGGRNYNNVTNNATRDNAYYYSTVDDLGNISTPSAKVANHPISQLMYMGMCVAGPNKEFLYSFGGYNNTPANVNNIYKSNINLTDGSIGAFASAGNLPAALREVCLKVSDDGLKIYAIGGLNTAGNNTFTIYVYSVNPTTGALTLTNTVNTTGIIFLAGNRSMYMTQDALFVFGNKQIYKLDIVNGIPQTQFNLVGNQVTGTRTAISHHTMVEDFNNIYLIGGYLSSTIMTSDEIHKISKADLLGASLTNLITSIILPTKFPLNIFNHNASSIVQTKKYILVAGVARKYTEHSTSDAFYTSTGGNYLLPKIVADTTINLGSLEVIKSNGLTPKEEFHKGYLYNRYRQEHLSNIVERKSNPTNFNYNNIPIKFLDPVNGSTIVLKSPDYWYHSITEENKQFLEWLNTICKETNFDGLNTYQLFTEMYGLTYLSHIPRNTLKFNIPELFIFMLLDINFYNILLDYLTDTKVLFPTELNISKHLNDFMKTKKIIGTPNINYGTKFNFKMNRAGNQLKTDEKIDYIFTPVIKNFGSMDVTSIKGPLWSHFNNNGSIVDYKLKPDIQLPFNTIKYNTTSGTYLNTGKMDKFEYTTTYGTPNINGIYLYNAEIYFNNNGVETNLRTYITGLPFRYSGTNSVIISKDGIDILQIYAANAQMLANIYNTSGKYLSNHWKVGWFTLLGLNDHFGAINRVSYNYGSSTMGNPGSMVAYANGIYVRIPHDPNQSGYNDVFTGKAKTGTYYIDGLEDNFYEQVFAEIPYSLIPISETINPGESILQYDKLDRITSLNEINFNLE